MEMVTASASRDSCRKMALWLGVSFRKVPSSFKKMVLLLWVIIFQHLVFSWLFYSPASCRHELFANNNDSFETEDAVSPG